MCGRYALHLPPSEVRQRLADQDMPSDDAPSDDDTQFRRTYNFAPTYHGLIYRADTPDYGASYNAASDSDTVENVTGDNGTGDDRTGDTATGGDHSSRKRNAGDSAELTSRPPVDGGPSTAGRFRLQVAKWGLIPSWSRRAPADFAATMRTINCRDDSLWQNGGLWQTMKQRKRCVVVAEGFYEWLKKPGSKDKLPHYVKRADGGLMCFAGLWDCAKYDNSREKVYSYTIITTDSNEQLKFLHDRMPAILEPNSEAMTMWLDPENAGWSDELQNLLHPFEGELECYPVNTAVGKVGNNSSSFVVPIDSPQNKKSIANFFVRSPESQKKVKNEMSPDQRTDASTAREGTESNAPLPKLEEIECGNEFEAALRRDVAQASGSTSTATRKHKLDEEMEKEIQGGNDHWLLRASEDSSRNVVGDADIHQDIGEVDDEALLEAANSPPRKLVKREPTSVAPGEATPSSRTRSATARKGNVK